MLTNKIEIPSLEVINRQLEINKLEDDLFEFVLWVFRVVYKKKFKINWHHKMLCKILMDIYNGKLHHTIINMPPRYTKTEIIVKIFPAWCFAKNPSCNFLHLSYADDLALDNSSAVKEIVESVEFQAMWHVPLKTDSTAKKKWKTEFKGEFSATAAGGKVTGFGAGILGSEVFAGALIVDDPIKPDDAKSDALRNAINNRFPETIKSRLNDRRTPMIIVMQRIHEDDPTGFLLGGGTELNFTHINLPAINEDGKSEYDIREVGEALWPDKHTEDELEEMRKKAALVFAGQYQQRPAPKEGNIFKNFNYYKTIPDDLNYRVHSWDLTFKAQSKSKKGKVDYVVGSEWGKRAFNGDIYLLPHFIRKKMGFSDTQDEMNDFILKHPNFKAILIEDKANGSAIIDSLKKSGVKRIIEVEPSGSKEERAEAVAPLYRSKNVWLPHPSICPEIEDWVNEHKVFPNGKHDDQVDSGTQAVEYLDKIGSTSMKEANKAKSTPFRNKFTTKRKGIESRIKIARQ